MTNKSALIAKLQRQVKGVHQKIKDQVVELTGRQLEPNMNNAVAQLRSVELQECQADFAKNKPMLVINAVCIEDEKDSGSTEYAGVPFNITYFLMDSKFPSGDTITVADQMANVYASLKLLGYKEEVESAEDEGVVFTEVIDKITSERPYFAFNTSKTKNAKGYVKAYIKGRLEDDYQPPDGSRTQQFVPAVNDQLLWISDTEDAEIEVVSVDEKDRTVTATYLDTNESVDGPISWDQLDLIPT